MAKAKLFDVKDFEREYKNRRVKEVSAALKLFEAPVKAKHNLEYAKHQIEGGYDPLRNEKNVYSGGGPRGGRATPPKIVNVMKRRDVMWQTQTYDIQYKYKVRQTKDGLVVEVVVSSTVLDENGNPHNLWYWLDQGTKTFTHSNFSPSLYPTGWHRYDPGDTQRGIDPKGWSDEIALNIKSYVRGRIGTITGIEDGWEVDHRFEMPKLIARPESRKIQY